MTVTDCLPLTHSLDRSCSSLLLGWPASLRLPVWELELIKNDLLIVLTMYVESSTGFSLLSRTRCCQAKLTLVKNSINWQATDSKFAILCPFPVWISGVPASICVLVAPPCLGGVIGGVRGGHLTPPTYFTQPDVTSAHSTQSGPQHNICSPHTALTLLTTRSLSLDNF